MAASNAGNGSAVPSQDGHALSGDKAVSEAVRATARFMEYFNLPQVEEMRRYIDERLDCRDQCELCEQLAGLMTCHSAYDLIFVERLNMMVHADVWERSTYQYHDGDDSINGVSYELVLDDAFGYSRAKALLLVLLLAAAAPLAIEDSWFRGLKVDAGYFPAIPVLRDECYGADIFGQRVSVPYLGTLENPLFDDTLPKLVTQFWRGWSE